MSQRDLKPWMMPWPMHVERMHHETIQRLPQVYQHLKSEQSGWYSYISTKNTANNRKRDEESSIPMVWIGADVRMIGSDHRHQVGSSSITSELEIRITSRASEAVVPPLPSPLVSPARIKISSAWLRLSSIPYRLSCPTCLAAEGTTKVK